MDMVEKVARAMAERNNDYDEEGRLQWPAYVDDARAAIAAMREPTDAMVDAGWQTSDDVVWMALKEAWPAMVDAALTSSEK